MGSMTITTTAPQDTRIVAAFGAKLGLPGDASAAEIKADLITYLKGIVHSYETQQAAAVAADGVVAMPDPT
jgi:hypothetical protein